LELQLRAQGRPFKVREPEPLEPLEPSPEEPAKPPDGRRERPDYIRLRIPEGPEYPGLCRPGDTLVCERTYVHGTAKGLRTKGLLGQWFVLMRTLKGDVFHRDSTDRQPLFRIVKLTGSACRTINVAGIDDSGEWVEGLKIEGSDYWDHYRPIEVQPGSDQDWRADPEFLAAVRMLKA
jgi:hypothetical protein